MAPGHDGKSSEKLPSIVSTVSLLYRQTTDHDCLQHRLNNTDVMESVVLLIVLIGLGVGFLGTESTYNTI